MRFRERISNAMFAMAEAAQGQRIGAAIFSGVSAGIGAMVNVYEAAQPSNPNRSWLPAWVRDAKYDITSFTRWELTRKIRYFEQNMWLISRLREQYTKYTVGPNGLTVIPASSDTEWNKKAAIAYAKWCEQPCLDANYSMSTCHKIMASGAFIDGEIFILKTSAKASAKSQSIPKIQFIESHRCSASPVGFEDVWADNKNNDGVIVNDDGKPIIYSMWESSQLDDKGPIPVPADKIIHVFKPGRTAQYRGITPFHACLNALHDLDDLELLEMQRAKDASAISNVLETWSGEIDKTTLRQQRFGIGTNGDPTNPSTADLNKRIEQYRQIIGARTISIKPGEKISQLKTETPSASTQWYWRYKVSQVCSCVAVPMILILPESIQGTVARGVLDDANISFQSDFEIFGRAAIDVYRFFMKWAIYNVPGLQDPPADWDACHVKPPRSVNVDVGRNSAAVLAEYAAGTMSLDTIAGAAGTTAEALTRQKAKNVKMINEIAKEYGIEPADICAPLAGIVQALASANQMNAQAEASVNQPEGELVDA